jgi:hypothetical protein
MKHCLIEQSRDHAVWPDRQRLDSVVHNICATLEISIGQRLAAHCVLSEQRCFVSTTGQQAIVFAIARRSQQREGDRTCGVLHHALIHLSLLWIVDPIVMRLHAREVLLRVGANVGSAELRTRKVRGSQAALSMPVTPVPKRAAFEPRDRPRETFRWNG